MKSFSDWYEQRLLSDDSHDSGVLSRLWHLAWKQNNEQSRAFFKKLSTINPEIAAEYERLSNKSFSKSEDERAEKEKEEIQVPSADTPHAYDF